MNNYAKYTVTNSLDPQFYGPSCGQDAASEIVERLAQMLKKAFPEINVACATYLENSSMVYGPDEKVVNGIRYWIDENWTKAL